MKSIIALLALTCAASRAAAAICNAGRGDSCPQPNQRACENNGGHSMVCVEKSRGKYNWIYADNCPSSGQHCDCADGFCKPN
ncbi:hypothetical protein HBH82_203220 [Parastagonospora nodorum]|nr:hypothetical protein HBH82_203220 [Parastagonospora nodorum]KAH4670135.1 hypothetical protein HBH78_185550 [Parastagonospora nodorum]KAH4708968.1 hypothetical protein HBH67_059750 [Parastagonospora nodorum]KAH4762487.1 hypothetical protein HBH63_201450 [Parastagonospora nodorum]KAH4771911.1 hypothetical protein HBH62_204510 [Parastagonospora nodorum]